LALYPIDDNKVYNQDIVDFESNNDDKVEMFNRVKSLADQDQQWRFNTTTEFTVDENKDIIVSRVFNININAQDYHNDAEKNTMHSLFSEELSLDIYKHDIHFDQKAFQSGMLKIH
ncbi:type III effector protein, partial [Escherichia coli]|nr:type III effector protein [Escherichia coli]